MQFSNEPHSEYFHKVRLEPIINVHNFLNSRQPDFPPEEHAENFFDKNVEETIAGSPTNKLK